MFSFVLNSLISMTLKTVKCEGKIGRDNGFGSRYVWAASLESGFQLARNHQKPMMLIIHKSWCRSCMRFKRKFADSSQIQGLSHHFVMVNVMDDDEPEEPKYAPDGDYIPRILFLSHLGDVFNDVYNEQGDQEFRYYYSRPEQVANAMHRVIHMLGIPRQ